MDKQEQKIKELEEQISKLKSSVSELRVLNEIAISSGKATDIDQMLNTIVHKCIKALEAEQGSILLVTKDIDKPFKTFVRQEDSSGLKQAYHIGTNITGWVLKYKKPLIIENLSEDSRFKPSENEKKDIKSVLCVPIWFEGEIIGLMMLINKKNQKHFTQNDLTMFSIISVQAGQLIKNLELQRKSFQERQESEKLQELDRLKTNFFTNISHEFRTPLTLILGPAKQILDQAGESKLKEQAETIFRNGAKLKNLANQILDLSRIDAAQMKLKTRPGNLIDDIDKIVSSFQSLAEVKNVSLKFIPQKDKIILYLDPDKIDKIMSNLLSNALKFTTEGGSVSVQVKIDQHINSELKKDEDESEFVQIAISDTGIGIPKEKIEKIFDRFYQVESCLTKTFEGTGIGLSLTKELVELHKGKINVESEVGKGTTFKVFLPMGKKHLHPDEIVKNENDKENIDTLESEETVEISSSILGSVIEKDDSKQKPKNEFNEIELKPNQKTEKPLLLVIEDNDEVRKFIIDILKPDYKITQAIDGEEGLSKAYDTIPELIISDVMMPKLDGNQLCMKLKSDTRTSHVPLILLTAKSSISDKIEGLKTGADDYIMKPFEESELKARIKNLLEQRRRVHEHFQKHGFLIDEFKVASIDQKFLQQTISAISKFLQDSNFTVEKLAQEMAMSRSLLHKKLISLVGESPSDLIRRIRLNKAVKLIEQKAFNISEVAFEVGFNNPSYFAKCFQKQFGFSPSQYHQNPANQ